MSSPKPISTDVAEAGKTANNVEPFLSPESQQDLDDALDETPSAEDTKNAWVNENIRDLYRAFAKSRKKGGTSAAMQDKEGVEVFSAVEGTGTGRRDLRCALGDIYGTYGRLAMYDRGIDDLARHCVVGYKSTRGQQTVEKVVLHVSGTEWTRGCRMMDNLAAEIEVEDPTFPDEDDWAVVAGPVGGRQGG